MLRHPLLDWELARQRQAEYERAAEIERLIAAGQTERPRLIRLGLLTMADLLIEMGLRLREHAHPDLDGGVETGFEVETLGRR
jgi:hypothetical protein